MGDALGAVMLIHRCGGRTLGDRGGEKPFGLGHGEKCGHDARAGGLTEHRHPGWITAECRDVVAHPPQCREHVAQTHIGIEPSAAPAHAREVEKPEDPESVVDRHDDHVALGGEAPPAVERLTARPEHERAPVDPHHHRFAVAGLGGRWRPDIQVQTVLVLRSSEVQREGRDRRLRTDRTVAGGTGHLGPGLRGLGCPEAKVSDWRRRVANTLPRRRPPVVDATDRAVDGFSHGVVDVHAARAVLSGLARVYR